MPTAQLMPKASQANRGIKTTMRQDVGIERYSRRLILQPDGSPCSNDTIIEEDKDVGNAQIGERIGSGGIEPGKQNGCDAYRHDDPASYVTENGSKNKTDGKGYETGCKHFSFADQSLCQGSFEPYPALLVCAALVVIVVIDEVAEYLQGKSTKQSQQRR